MRELRTPQRGSTAQRRKQASQRVNSARARASEQTFVRMRLLRAAIELVTLEGYESVSVEAVCGRAGLEQVAFYDRFEELEACCAAALEDALLRIRARMVEAGLGRESWADRLRARMRALMGLLDEEPLMARFVFVESADDPPAIRSARAELRGRLVELAEEGGGDPHRLIDPSPYAAARLVDYVFGFLSDWLAADQVFSLTEMGEALGGLVVLSYRD